MADLERELLALGAWVDFPATPELAGRVRARLGERRRRPWRLVAVVAAVLVVALGAAFAVPQSRSAILRFFGLKGVSVIQVDRLPPAGRGPIAFGELTTLASAERELGFHALLPRLGRPDRVYVDAAGGYLILLYGEPRPRLRLSEFRQAGPLIQKLTKFGQEVEPLTVNGGPGLWVPSGHVVFELGRQPRLAGSTLLWQQAGLVLRIEGRLSKARALEIARSVHG
jgi:hypothetical protein